MVTDDYEPLPEGGMGERIVMAMLAMRFSADDPGAIAARAGCAESTVRRWLPILLKGRWVQQTHRFNWWSPSGQAHRVYPDVVRDHNPYAEGAQAA